MSRWRKLSPRERIVFVAACALLAAFLSDKFVFTSLSESWSGLDRDISAREARLIHDRALLARKDSLLREYKMYAPSASKPSGSDERTALLKEIGAGAKAAGVKLVDIKPAEGGRGVSLSTESSWESLASFLYILQRSPRMLRVERASIRSKGETPALSAHLVVMLSPIDQYHD
jgi:type II secretory pathway component PulM